MALLPHPLWKQHKPSWKHLWKHIIIIKVESIRVVYGNTMETMFIKKPTNVGFLERWYPVGESNPCCRDENPVS